MPELERKPGPATHVLVKDAIVTVKTGLVFVQEGTEARRIAGSQLVPAGGTLFWLEYCEYYKEDKEMNHGN